MSTWMCAKRRSGMGMAVAGGVMCVCILFWLLAWEALAGPDGDVGGHVRPNETGGKPTTGGSDTVDGHDTFEIYLSQ
jgi:hypothetical protein